MPNKSRKQVQRYLGKFAGIKLASTYLSQYEMLAFICTTRLGNYNAVYAGPAH